MSQESIDGHTGVASYEASTEVGLVDYSKIRNSSSLKTTATTNCLTCTTETHENAYVNENLRRKDDIMSYKLAIGDSIDDHRGISRDYIVAQDP